MRQKVLITNIGVLHNPVFINNSNVIKSLYYSLISLVVVINLLIYCMTRLSTLGQPSTMMAIK